jgi:hypothetical protein
MPRAFPLVAAALFLGISPGAIQSAGAQPASGSKTRSDTVDFSPTGTVEIDNQKGSITVTTWDRAQVGYEMTLAPSEDDSVVVMGPNVDRSGQKLSLGHGTDSWSIQIPGILTISPNRGNDPVGDYRIVMPKTAALEIGDFASTIEVTDIEANVDIDTHQGTAQIRNVEGTPTLETHAGSIEATGLRGGAKLETHEGRIAASFEEFTASSSVDTHSGTVRLFLPAEAGFELQLDLDEEHLTVDEAFGTPTSSDDERRAYNGGGPPFELESFSGTVEVRPLEAGSSPSP